MESRAWIIDNFVLQKLSVNLIDHSVISSTVSKNRLFYKASELLQIPQVMWFLVISFWLPGAASAISRVQNKREIMKKKFLEKWVGMGTKLNLHISIHFGKCRVTKLVRKSINPSKQHEKILTKDIKTPLRVWEVKFEFSQRAAIKWNLNLNVLKHTTLERLRAISPKNARWKVTEWSQPRSTNLKVKFCAISFRKSEDMHTWRWLFSCALWNPTFASNLSRDKETQVAHGALLTISEHTSYSYDLKSSFTSLIAQNTS